MRWRRTGGAAEVPEEPFLFFREPPNWRWISFEEAGRRIRQWGERLADPQARSSSELPPSPSVEALLAHLAALSSGLELDFDGAGQDGTRQHAGAEGLVDSHSAFPNGDAFAETREIVVHGRPLSDLCERSIVEQAVRTAAAIVVESEPEALPLTLFWVRPTLLHGSAADLSLWAQMFLAGEKGQSGVASRFARLRRVVVCDQSPLEKAALELFEATGAEIVRPADL